MKKIMWVRTSVLSFRNRKYLFKLEYSTFKLDFNIHCHHISVARKMLKNIPTTRTSVFIAILNNRDQVRTLETMV